MTAGMVSMADVVEGRERWHVQHADCRFALSCLPDACIDAIVCDPPYDLTANKKGGSGVASVNLDSPYGRSRIGTGNGAGGFMGKSWDATGIAFDPATWREALRVLKPGGHLLAFGGTRTFHRMACAIEDAGFEIRDCLSWLYGTGFPKSLNVSEAIDAALGATREIVGPPKQQRGRASGAYSETRRVSYDYPAKDITAPATQAAAAAVGLGTALKPAWEPIVMARRPLAGTVAANVLQHGTGALNIDACRVQSGPSADGSVSGDNAFGQDSGWNAHENRTTEIDRTMAAGRWPPNVLFAHADGCRQVGTKRVAGDPRGLPGGTRPGGFGNVGGDSGDAAPNAKVYGDPDGSETVAAWECVPGCPVAALDAQSGERPGMSSGGDGARDASMFGVGGITKPETVRADTGGASRFFPQFQAGEADVPFYYTAKASTAERMAGLDERSVHPTVKPLALMQYLVRLVTPPGGVVLDPFAGSGTTGVAAMLEKGGFRFLGVEREPEYVAIAEARIQHVAGGRWKSPQESAAEAVATGKKKQLTLF